jgi:hypothetical protein
VLLFLGFPTDFCLSGVYLNTVCTVHSEERTVQLVALFPHVIGIRNLPFIISEIIFVSLHISNNPLIGTDRPHAIFFLSFFLSFFFSTTSSSSSYSGIRFLGGG